VILSAARDICSHETLVPSLKTGQTHLLLARHNHLEGAHCCTPLGFIQLLCGVQALQQIKGLQARCM
jgi:hypothetical protein